jgi:excinuclease ABC subunit B
LSHDDRPDIKELRNATMGRTSLDIAADPIVEHLTRQQIEKLIAETTRRMKEAAKQLDFLQAAQYRDEIIRLQKEIELK